MTDKPIGDEAMDGMLLVLNSGSSSIKFSLYDASASPLPRDAAWTGKVEGVGSHAPRYADSTVPARALPLPGDRPYLGALQAIQARVQQRLDGRRLVAVAHRVVHGGSKYFQPIRVDADVLADLRSYIPLAPLHQPYALEAIAQLLRQRPRLPQVACFDTGFHQTLAPVEQMMALPWSAWERGLRRYGFHGLSYEYQSIALAERHGDAARGRTLVAHLGSGASLCAMRGLRSVATTMGFSALDGLMMGTRCGALDPGAVIYLMQIEKLDLDQVGHMLYHQSGLLGVSGVSSDPRELLPLEAGNPRVAAALALYVHRIVQEIGALTATLGGLDMLVFTAGIGEHNAELRARVCRALSFMGVKIDAAANEANATTVSAQDSRIVVAVEPTNEEWIAARHALRLLNGTP